MQLFGMTLASYTQTKVYRWAHSFHTRSSDSTEPLWCVYTNIYNGIYNHYVLFYYILRQINTIL